MSGHSKYSNIKHRKNAQDAKRAKLFMSILKRIMIEAKNNNNLETNSQLRILVTKAKKNNIPKEKIEKAIYNPLINVDYKEIIYECFLPNNNNCIIYCLTENQKATFSDIKKIFNKYNAHIGLKNSVICKYQSVFVIYCNKNLISNNILEKIILETPIIEYKISEEIYTLNYRIENKKEILKFWNLNDISYTDMDSEYIPFVYNENSNVTNSKLKNFVTQINDLPFVEKIMYNFKISE